MRFRFKKWLLITPIAIGAFLLILIWAADSWLESPAGRARVEASLENALGMPVRLQKGFSVSLLPEPGVEGEGLEIGESGNDGLLLRCESFHASVSLMCSCRPIGQISISWSMSPSAASH